MTAINTNLPTSTERTPDPFGFIPISAECDLCAKVKETYGREHPRARNKAQYVCKECAAEELRAHMLEHGSVTLYLAWCQQEGGGVSDVRVQDFLGGLVFKAEHRTSTVRAFGRHVRQIAVRFKGPDGFVWSGVHRGGSHTIIRVKRTKEKAT